MHPSVLTGLSYRPNRTLWNNLTQDLAVSAAVGTSLAHVLFRARRPSI